MTRVYGYMRFSFLGRNNTKLARAEMADEQRFAQLYDPLRMEQRFHFFENICLPSLRAQTEQDFRMIILASPEMPDDYKHRLETGVATLPQGEVHYSTAEHVTPALNPRIQELTRNSLTTTFHFRLDDDDAIANSLVARMAQYCQVAVRDEMLTFPRGLLLIEHEGQTHLLRKFEDNIAIGFGFFSQPGQLRNPYACQHGNHYRNVPARIEPCLHSYIHVAHPASDTLQAQWRKLKAAKRHDPGFETDRCRRRIETILTASFPFNSDELRAIMAATPSKPPLAAPTVKPRAVATALTGG